VDDARRTYLLASAPDWIAIGLLAWAAVRWLELAPWMAMLIAAAWIVKDVLLYPSMRRYYAAEPAARRIIGEQGVTLCRIDPHGFARVHGEIWQVHVAAGEAPLPAGTPVRVRDIAGLELLVEPQRQ
jgi:membrane protein implicated in regulation of membrane protease activity